MLPCVVLIACLGGSAARGDAGSRVWGCPSSEVESESTFLVSLNNIHSATTILCKYTFHANIRHTSHSTVKGPSKVLEKSYAESCIS
jgi:hypothetical protein